MDSPVILAGFGSPPVFKVLVAKISEIETEARIQKHLALSQSLLSKVFS